MKALSFVLLLLLVLVCCLSMAVGQTSGNTKQAQGYEYQSPQDFSVTVATPATGFSITLAISDNASNNSSLVFGLDRSASYCIDPALGEVEMPPGIGLYARFIDSRSGSTCLGGGLTTNYHYWPDVSVNDTFRVRISDDYNDGSTYPIHISWPSGLNQDYNSLSIRYTDINSGPQQVNMLNATSLDIQDQGGFPITLNIYGTNVGYGSTTQAPVVVTNPASDITGTSATLNGSVTSSTAATAHFEWGLTTSYGNVTADIGVSVASGPVPISVGLTGLIPGTTYHYRDAATNSGGIGYGDEQSFTTAAPQAPAVVTNPASNITGTSATLNGTVSSSTAATAHFDWGLTTLYGSMTSNIDVSVASGPVPISFGLTSLTPGMTYHYRALATNSGGTGIGDDQSFTTATLASALVTIPLKIVFGPDSTTLRFGVDPTATYCIDPALGESFAPPPAPLGVFDARFIDPRGYNGICMGSGLSSDFRHWETSAVADTFETQVQKGSSTGNTYVVSWPSGLSQYFSSCTLVDLSGGSLVNVNMLVDSSKAITNAALTQLYVIAQPIPYGTVVAPPIPVLSSPLNGATDQPTSLTLSWNTSSGATSYHLQVSTDPTFTTNFLDDSTLSATSRFVSGLANNTTYSWRVSATGVGGTSAYTSYWSITTGSPSTWTDVNTGLTQGDVRAFATSGPNLFAGTYGGGVFRSTNNGTTWTAANVGLTNTYVQALVVSGTNLFAGTYGGGVFKSTNYGTTWSALNTKSNVRALAVSGTNLFAGVNSSTPGENVWVSTDNGANWTATGNGLPTVGVRVLAVSGTNLLAGFWAALGVFLSTDNGASWTAVNSGLTSNYVYALAGSGTNLFAGTDAGVFLSTNNGSSWAAANTGLTNPIVSSIGVAGTILFAGSGGGTFLSTDNAGNWTPDDVNLAMQGVNAFSAGGIGTSMFAGTNGNGVWRRSLSPPTPTLVSPASGATDQPTSLTLSWGASSGATSYHWQVSTDLTFSTTFLDISSYSTTSVQVFGLANGTTYYWRVSASNSGGTSSFSSAWTFTTILEAPPIPVLSSPPNEATDQPTSLTLSWNASAGATSYHLQVSTNQNFFPIIVDVPTLTTTSDLVSGLANSTTYYWHVWASNGGGSNGSSSAWTFTTMPAAPPVPVLSSPLNGATNQPVNPVLIWNITSLATSYQLQVGIDSTFASGMVFDDSTLADTSKAVAGLSNAAKYYWRVQAKNIGGTSAWSSVWNFTTIVASPPAPALAFPANGATNQPVNPVLFWKTTSLATSYQLQVGLDSTFASGMVFDDSTLADTSKAVTGLSNATKYYWRVEAKNIGGTSAWSSVWNFTTIVASPLSPALASPADGATNQPVNPGLFWKTTSLATSYQVQVGSDSTFASGIVFSDSTLTDTSKAVTGLSNATKYYWRVEAKNIGGTSAWSSVWNFTTIVASPPAPSLVSPMNGTTTYVNAVTLLWNPSMRASNYRMQVSTSSSFTTTVADDSTLTDTSKQVSSLVFGTSYYWRVEATNIGGVSAWSDVWQFTIQSSDRISAYLIVHDNESGRDSLVFGSDRHGSYCIDASLGEVELGVPPGAGVFDTRFVDPRGFSSCMGQGLRVNHHYWPDVVVTDTFQVKFQPGTGGYPMHLSWPSGLSSNYNSLVMQDLLGGAVVNLNMFTDTSVSIINAGIVAVNVIAQAYAYSPGGLPVVPELALPPNGSINQPANLLLHWKKSPFASKYQVQAATDSMFNVGVTANDSTITDTARSLDGLTNDTRYYWRVRSENGSGMSAWSSAWNFTTIGAVPSPPTLVTPSNGAQNQSISVMLIWRNVMLSASYHVQVGTDSMFNTGVIVNDSSLTDTTRVLGALANDTKYYWRVRVKNIAGIGAWSSVWSFATIIALPSQVTLLSPTNGQSLGVDSVIFIWYQGQPKVTRYWFEYSIDSLFTFTHVDSNVTETFIVKNHLANYQYWWRVRAHNAAGWGPFSGVRMCTILATDVAEKHPLPTQYMLHQNYPNPFNPATTLQYDLPVESRVRLTVYNLLGQVVSILVDKVERAGYGSANWDASNLASGLYFYRIEATSVADPNRTFTSVKKMIVLK